MKAVFFSFSVILLILTELFPTPLLAQSPDTIKQIPFIENWESASFDTNDWNFPYMQGNWTIMTTEGNPEPCAVFTGTPSKTNYIYALQSPWLDASQLTCDKISLSFDLKLENVNPTGLEHFRIELLTDTMTRTLCSYQNTTSFAWQSVLLNISSVGNQVFRIRFIAQGGYSPSFTGWFLDNIQITHERNGPKNLEPYEAGGHCTLSDSTCIVGFIWEPPNCNPDFELVEFLFDDGSAENGWRLSEGFFGWLGNEFPIDPPITGIIQSVDLWWGYLPGGSPSLTVDIFDGSRTLVGSSAPFDTPSYDWITVPIADVPFSGLFYAMVKWEGTGSANYLGFDENGPYASQDLEWYYDGSAWDKLTNLAGSDPGLFLIRVNAIVFFDGIQDTSDSTVLLGYNIYYHDWWTDDGTQKKFVKRNSDPVIDTFYTDYIPCAGDYYVTALFSDSVEVPSNIIYEIGCVEGMTETRVQPDIVVRPNPANEVVEIESSAFFSEIRITDLFGRVRFSEQFIETKDVRLRLSVLASGTYIVTIITDTGPVNRKLILSR
ncbi:MAG: T9SS type A sorting domain-containing protein [Bacteroidales bacterium]|nr:T9SS type A sorting domain-containing protein [Bacteroidales bacterium]